MVEHASLPPVWIALADAPKRQHLTTLQGPFDDTSRRMSIRAPIFMTSSRLKMTLAIGFYLNNRYDLGTGLHQFCLGWHTSAAWKMLKVRVDQNQFIEGGGGAPTLADVAYLTALYEVPLP